VLSKQWQDCWITTRVLHAVFKHIHFFLDCKISNLYSSLSGPLPGANQYWCHMKKHGRDPIGVEPMIPGLIVRHLNNKVIAPLENLVPQNQQNKQN
jgi:hypothetical protein